MAIITPLKKIFNWQTASEKIPYKVYTAYITVTNDGNENMYASKVLENTIGDIKFENFGTGSWKIILPYQVPRCSIVMPGFGNWWSYGQTGMKILTSTPTDYIFTMNPGYHPTSDDPINSMVNNIEVYTWDNATAGSISWDTAFSTPGSTAPYTSVAIEIRVYN